MAWSDGYVGFPYREGGRGHDGIDCLGLFLLVQREQFGRALTDPGCTAPEAVRRRVVEGARQDWAEIEPGAAQAGDALLFRIEGYPLHIACALNPVFMLHAERGIGSVVECWTGIAWRNRLEGAFRYVGE